MAPPAVSDISDHTRAPARRPGVLHLGIDTGGTFTDAVLFDSTARCVVASAKSPTTHHDLATGIGKAMSAVIAAGDALADEVGLVSLSTTLATNALVEGRGRPMAAVLIGFDDDVVGRGGLRNALGDDPLIMVAGGHDPHGVPRCELDAVSLRAAVAELPSTVRAVAITSAFSVRNSSHEVEAADIVREATGLPVTISSELSSRLDGPKRAVTAMLNARLISIIDDLLRATDRTLSLLGLDAPVMVVRGDGSLVSSSYVRTRPIETILSGPAASIVGAAFLTGCRDAVVVDIGGTTSDVGILRNGAPTVDDDGAEVGGYRTMVRAVKMQTIGLGGDSEVTTVAGQDAAVVAIGPRRVRPLSSLGQRWPGVQRILERQLAGSTTETDGTFFEVIGTPTSVEDERVRTLLGAEPVAATEIATTASFRRTLARSVHRGFVERSAFTPTDAAHALGEQHHYDAATARLAAEVLARSRDQRGRAISSDGTELARTVHQSMIRRIAAALLGAALADDGLPIDSSILDRIGKAAPRTARLDVGIQLPIVALGAAAPTYADPVAVTLGTSAHVPAHAGVANAVGAVVGTVRIESSCVIVSPTPGVFLTHAGTERMTSMSFDEARENAELHLRNFIEQEFHQASGGSSFDLQWRWRETTVPAGEQTLFIEGELVATAVGRPALR
jgi:N-methylhydantoinase A/oxoprolinase/acetone carboxylase beta subunit